MKPKKVASLVAGNKEIWDYRNLGIIDRIKIAYSLVRFGIVDIQWNKSNIKIWEMKK